MAVRAVTSYESPNDTRAKYSASALRVQGDPGLDIIPVWVTVTNMLRCYAK